MLRRHSGSSAFGNLPLVAPFSPRFISEGAINPRSFHPTPRWQGAGAAAAVMTCELLFHGGCKMQLILGSKRVSRSRQWQCEGQAGSLWAQSSWFPQPIPARKFPYKCVFVLEKGSLPSWECSGICQGSLGTFAGRQTNSC